MATTQIARRYGKPARQQPHYPDRSAIHRVRRELRRRAPLVSPAEIRALRHKLAKATRGEAFVLQAGPCAEQFGQSEQTITDMVQVILQMAMILMYGAETEVVKIIRGAGVYGKPRSSDVDSTGLPSFRGELINGPEATPEARAHNPERLLGGYDNALATLTVLRKLAGGGMTSLSRVHEWNLAFVRSSAQGHAYEQVAHQIERSLGFMRACGVDVDTMPAIQVAEFFTSHEGLVFDYEAPLTRRRYATSGHFLWIGERTRGFDEAHVEYFRRIQNPIGVKLGPTTTPADVVRYCQILNPDRIPGRLVFIARMGAHKLGDVLPGLVRAVAEAGYPVVWMNDPMHGNTIDVGGIKTRRLIDVMTELEEFFECFIALSHEGLDVYPGGIHLESTGDDVTECLGGFGQITAADLSRTYTTTVDPRLNANQSIEVAFFVTQLLAKYRGQILAK